MWPLAPGLFSIKTCSFQISISLGAIRRARPSAPPPGGKGTTMRTGLAGNSCDHAAAQMSSASSAAKSLTASDDVGEERGDALDPALDHVAALEEELGRVRLADRDAAGRAGGEHVARPERDVTREVLDDVGQLPDLVARIDPHALHAVHAAGHPQVVRIADLVHGDDLGPERAEARDVLAGPEARARG